MPQLWIETFVSQYFWLLTILFTFYYFIATKVIPTIANSIKARQTTDSLETKTEETSDINNKTNNLFMVNNKLNIALSTINLDLVQNEWLATSPETNNTYWTEINLISSLSNEIEEENETLEEFLKSE